MKRIIIILAFLICGIVSAQNPAYFFNGRVDVPRTTAQILATASPVEGLAFMSSDTDTLWRYQGGVWVDTGIGGDGTWGSITGTLSDQTDLQSALGSKLQSGDNVSELVNDAGYITEGGNLIPVTQAEYDLLTPTEISENDYAIVDESTGSTGGGDMLKSTYDTNNNGIVDTVDDGSVSVVKLSSSFYDTGVFTPTLIDAGGGATYSLSIENGKYTRIGNIVYVWIYVAITGTTGTPTGNLRIGNLPISAPSNYHAISVGRFQGSDISFYSIYGYVWNDYIDFHIQTSLDGNISEPLDNVTITSGAIVVSGTYTIN